MKGVGRGVGRCLKRKVRGWENGYRMVRIKERGMEGVKEGA